MLTHAIDQTSDAAALTELVLEVFRLNGALVAFGDELVAPLGLTSARWQVLGSLSLADGPLTVPEIAEAMGLTRQGAQRQVNLLLDDGLVRRRPNPGHRRSSFIELTRAGRSAYDGASRAWDRHARRLAELAGSRAVRTSTSTLRRLASNLEGEA